tara:strand:+ start:92 stop:850 length:759 start_codon:yes stop_codon:yes gene_type:complete
MVFDNSVVDDVTAYLDDWLVSKIAGFDIGAPHMPFLSRIIRNERDVASYSKVHSISTVFGQSIYEQISVIIANSNSDDAEHQRDIPIEISQARRDLITQIIDDLNAGNREPNRQAEMEQILATPNEDVHCVIPKPKKYDVFIRRGDDEYFFDLKTVKPNISDFAKFKEQMLQWIAREDHIVHTMMIFPYNPYLPEPFETAYQIGNMVSPNEYMVGEQYWDFIGGAGAYQQVLDIFDQVGAAHWNELNEIING